LNDSTNLEQKRVAEILRKKEDTNQMLNQFFENSPLGMGKYLEYNNRVTVGSCGRAC
jgi:hypothetical protein